MGKAEEIFKIEAEILNNNPSKGAILILVHDEKIWIPRSQLFDEEDLPENGHAEIKMSAWIAKEKGLR